MRPIDADALEKWMKRDDWGTPDERWRPESEFGAIIDAQPTVGEWISVKERLPKDSGAYLTARPYTLSTGINIERLSYGRIDKRTKKVWWRYDSEYGDVVVDGVTHWMQLPPPPEGGQDD